MKLVGLGGGIGSGKSSTSELLAQRGAVIVDADRIARLVVEPGHQSGALVKLVEHFGSQILASDGTLNRQKLAEKAFGDPEAVQALNAITHPAIGREIEAQIAVHQGTSAIVVLDAPLLFDRDRPGMVGKVLVDVDEEIAIARLVSWRGFDESDARRRVSAQMSRADRQAKADLIIDNSGTMAELSKQVERVWIWMQSLPESDLQPDVIVPG
jgi:dephospho-CoA kinase